MFGVLEKLSAPGNAARPNEDACGHRGNTAWVIDGATGQGPSVIADEGATDASWLAARLSLALDRNAEIFGGDLFGLIIACQSQIRQEFTSNLKAGIEDKADVPCGAVTVIHCDGKRIYCAALSDTVLVLSGKDGRVDGWYGDPAHHKVDQGMIELFVRYREEGENDPVRLREKLRPYIRKQRQTTNTPGHFGTFDPISDLSGHIVQKSWRAEDYSHALLMSDGYSALSDKYSKYSYSSLMQAVRADGLDILYKELREIEEGDPDCRIYPRYKKSDDATALLASF